MAGSKRNRLRKAFSPTHHHHDTPQPVMDDGDEQLLDDLMAQLDSGDQNVQAGSAEVLNDMTMSKAAETPPHTPPKQDSRSRHKARQARKAAALVEHYTPSDPEADARLKREADEEERLIKQICDELGLEMYEINPDGHCLFSAVADQLALLKILSPAQATYAVCRHAAADYIHNHMDDFLPFLPSVGGEDTIGATSNTGLMSQAEFDRYCATIRDTGAWGGEPEILALSSAYNVPIHVVQGGTPPVVIHQPMGSHQSDVHDKRVVHISYHRRMYGLGEHYNSLRPKRTLSGTVKSVITGQP